MMKMASVAECNSCLLLVVGVHSQKKKLFFFKLEVFYCFLFQGASGELINEVTIFTRVCNDATDSSSEATKRFNFSPVPLIFISCMRFRNTVVELRLMAREVKEEKRRDECKLKILFFPHFFYRLAGFLEHVSQFICVPLGDRFLSPKIHAFNGCDGWLGHCLRMLVHLFR